MGYKSLAQMPTRRNGPVSSNVRPHKCNVCVPRYAAKSEIQKKMPRPSQSANLKPGSMECILKNGTAMLARFFRRRFGSNLGNEVSSSSPPPFGAVSLRVVPVAAAGEINSRATREFCSLRLQFHGMLSVHRHSQILHQSSDA